MKDRTIDRILHTLFGAFLGAFVALSALWWWLSIKCRSTMAYVAYARQPLTREVRAANAKVYINTKFTSKQQVFLDFVLQHYVNIGVEELDAEKLMPLLKLKYHDAIADALADLGQPDQIRTMFTGFQQYLYAEAAA